MVSPRRPTLRQVAKEAGVSVAAASFALRNLPSVSFKTRDHVQAVAARMGYTKNALVSTWLAHVRSSGTTHYHATLGYFETTPRPETWDQYETFHCLYEGARRQAEASGYQLERFGLQDKDHTPERWKKILVARGIHGLIFHHVPSQQLPLLKIDFDISPFAVISLGTALESPRMSHAAPHHFWNVKEALTRLAGLGYERIGVYIDDWINERLGGVLLAAVLEFQSHLAPRHVVPPIRKATPGRSTFQGWYKKHRPDALLAFSETMPDVIAQLNLRMPDEIGYATTTKIKAFPQYAGVDPETETSGAAAVDLLISQLNNNERGSTRIPKMVLTEGVWKNGTTVRQSIRIAR